MYFLNGMFVEMVRNRTRSLVTNIKVDWKYVHSEHKVFYKDTYAWKPKKGEKLGMRIWKKN